MNIPKERQWLMKICKDVIGKIVRSCEHDDLTPSQQKGNWDVLQKYLGRYSDELTKLESGQEVENLEQMLADMQEVQRQLHGASYARASEAATNPGDPPIN